MTYLIAFYPSEHKRKATNELNNQRNYRKNISMHAFSLCKHLQNKSVLSFTVSNDFYFFLMLFYLFYPSCFWSKKSLWYSTMSLCLGPKRMIWKSSRKAPPSSRSGSVIIINCNYNNLAWAIIFIICVMLHLFDSYILFTGKVEEIICPNSSNSKLLF